MSRPYLVVGVGATGAAVARALRQRDAEVVLVDDRPGEPAQQVASELGLPLVEAPAPEELARLVAVAEAVLPAPGLPAAHPVFAAARQAGVVVLSEFDLAARWDDRPLLAITGTDGKTTVTTLVCQMLEASGLAAPAVGNTDVPLVAAVDDPTIDLFVVEASSFRLGHSQHFAPAVGTWLNFAPDHLDAHSSLAEYEAAKARLWRDQTPQQVAVGNAGDPVVARHLREAPAEHVWFSRDAPAGFRVEDGCLVTSDGQQICQVAELPRRYPHDLLNGLASAATALAGGATLAGVRDALVTFTGLPHRLALVGEADGVRFVDDSKATTPHAAVSAACAFDSVVLICGGRNKGLDLTPMAAASGHLRAVVGIGDAAPEVSAVFSQAELPRPVQVAESMDQAVTQAAELARPGDVVLLSPGCASFDWYGSYGERGDDFARAVGERLGASA